MRRVCDILAMVTLLTGGASAAVPNGVDVILHGYAGTWSVEIDHLDTPHSKAGHDKNILRNDCWKSSPFVACNQYVDGESKALLVFTYDAKADRYTSYPVPVDGSGVGKGALLIRGNTWTYPWEVKEGDKVTYFRVVNVFTGSNAIAYRQEFSADNEHWTVMARGQETRIIAAKMP